MPTPLPFRNFTIRCLVMCDVLHRELVNPKPEFVGTTPLPFRNFAIRRLMSCDVLHQELVNPETQICRDHTFTFS